MDEHLPKAAAFERLFCWELVDLIIDDIDIND